MSSSLTREEVRAAIRFGNPPRPPMAFVKWWGEGLWEQYGEQLRRFDSIEEDIDVIGFPVPAYEPREDGFYWTLPPKVSAGKVGHDNDALLPSWDALPALLAHLPNADAPHLFDAMKEAVAHSRKRGRYVLLHHWSLMYERIWQFRGMENLMMDYYDYPEEVHALHRAVADTENRLLRRAIAELHPDGYMISDDLGNQRALMMKPAHFRSFIKPYYAETWKLARDADVDVWLHTCGNVTEIVGDLIECGLSVLHPIQKHTMSWKETAEKWRGKLAFWVGMDVQDTLINGTPEDVRREVRLMRDTFDSPNGGFLYAAGNGIVGGTPIENIAAFLDECRTYRNEL